MKHYKLTDETMTLENGVVLHRVEYTVAIPERGIQIGDKGGWIEKEDNLQGLAVVLKEAQVYGNAEVFGNADVSGNAKVFGNAWVSGSAMVFGNAEVYGYAKVFGNAKVCEDADYIVFKNWWSSGRYFTWTRSNNMWKVGCFYGTGEKLIKKAYNDSEKSGREYERVVKYVQSILDENK